MVLLIYFPQQVYSQLDKPFVLDDTHNEYTMGPSLEIFEDITHQLSIEEISSSWYDPEFTKTSSTVLNRGIKNTVYWIHFQVTNNAQSTTQWWLELASTQVNHAQLFHAFESDSSGVAMGEFSESLAATGNEAGHFYPVFKLHLPVQSTKTFYLRIEGQRANVPLTLFTSAGFLKEVQKDFIILGLYFGILFIMTGFNFFLFLLLRDKSSQYYVLLMISFLFSELLQRNLLQQYLWPNLPWINTFFNAITVSTALFVFLLQFASSFLITKDNTPVIHKYFKGIQIGLITTSGLSLLWHNVNLFLVVWFILILNSIVLIFSAGIISWRRGYRPARYFNLAMEILLAAFLIYVLAILGVIPTSYTEYLTQIGIVLMTLLMSLALADRINIIKQDLEALEVKAQRSNRELTLLNQIISETTCSVEFKTVLETVCRELANMFNLRRGAAILFTDNNKNMEVSIDYSKANHISPDGRTLLYKGNALLEYIAGRGSLIVVENTGDNPSFGSLHMLLNIEPTTTIVVVPIFANQEFIGCVVLDPGSRRVFLEDELNLISRVIKQVEGALTRMQLVYDQQQLELQLYQGQKMDALGSLACGIAHDFNNLLVPIIGNAEMAKSDDPTNQELINHLKQILLAAGKASTLTRQILAFSRKQVLEKTPIVINEIVVDIEKLLRRLIGENIELITSLAPDLKPIKADRSQIEQVLLNLVVNARDAMQNGGNVLVETSNFLVDTILAQDLGDVRPGPYIMLTVYDNGCGMDEATLERIFEPFFTTKEQGKGTGLGLSTVNGIVKQHGGYISISSEIGRGTIITIFLPQTKEQLYAKSSLSDNFALTGTEIIVVVEDDDSVRETVGGMLQSYGYKVLKAKHPNEALCFFSKATQRIDLLLTDVVMPGMNGRELYERVYMLDPTIKVLYMSGYNDNIILRDGILEDGIGYLQKPFTAAVLAKKVRTVITHNK